MAKPAFELITVPSGACSLRSVEHGETFHPGIGPMEEARVLHVEQHRFEERMEKGVEFTVWDVGLGGGANALAAIEALRGAQARIELRSFDRTVEALRFALEHAERLEYTARWKPEIEQLLNEGAVSIGSVNWKIERGDFRERVTDARLPRPHAVMFDPYSPATNPEMWTRDVFRAIRERAAEDCTLTSYSRSTVTRVNLLRAGWNVGRGSATGEKTETTIAATRLELLRDPLRRGWLERVRRSTARDLLANGETAADLVRELEGCFADERRY